MPVELHEVSKAFGDHWAVREVTLRADDGRILVLVGPSGCGKTTTLRMIAGLERATSGTIHVRGRDVTNLHPKERDVAMVFQSYALYPHMTVRANLGFALKMRKTPRREIDARVEAVARSLGIDDVLARKPAQLSGGQQQRVALGRAIVREPAAFLLDEPLSNLDARRRVSTRSLIRSLARREGRATVYVTHDQEEAMSLADQLVVMSEGRVQQTGPPQLVHDRPANRFVAAFIGAPPMNFIDGIMRREGERAWFVPGGGAPGERISIPSEVTRDGPVVLGVRPASISLEEGLAAGDAGALAAEVTDVETLGDVVDMTCGRPDGTTLVARRPAGAAAPVGSPVRLRFDAARVHLFDPGPYGSRI